MKKNKSAQDRWNIHEDKPMKKWGLSRSRFYCDKCKAGFQGISGFERHKCSGRLGDE